MTLARWTEQARQDLKCVDDWYADIDSDYADRVGRAAIAAGRFLADFPRAGPVIDAETRKWRVPATPYILLYRIVDGGIEVTRLEHARQNWRDPVAT